MHSDAAAASLFALPHLSDEASSASRLLLVILAFVLLFLLPCLDRLATRRVQHDERVGTLRDGAAAAAALGLASLHLDTEPTQCIELLSPKTTATPVWPQLRQRTNAHGAFGPSPPAIHVYVPKRLLPAVHKERLLLVGWAVLAGPTCIVVVAAAMTHAAAEMHALVPLQTVPDDVTGLRPSLLGICQPGDPASGKGKARETPDGEDAVVWIESISRRAGSSAAVVLQTVRLPPAVDYPAGSSHGVNVVVIAYTPPQSATLQFLSLEPLVLLKPAQTLERHENPDAQRHIRYRHLSREARAQQLRLERLTALDPARAADLRPGQVKHTGAGSGLRMAVILMNSADEPFARPRPPASQTYGAAGDGVALLVRASAATCRALSWSLRQPLVRGRSIKDVSASVRQLDLRLRQIAVWPALGRRLRVQRRHERVPVSELSARYIGLWNGVWLVANDLILGSAVGSFVCEHHEQIAHTSAAWLRAHTIVQADELLIWLGQWPGGLKLNAELSLFFGDMFRGTIDVYALFVFAPLEQALPRLVYAIGLAGSLAGLTMLLSLSADLLAVATLHLSVMHRIARAVLVAFSALLLALFRLFRGKKRNWLRGGRIDSATYDADQRLLGTILFTILVFLFPTAMTYHVVFALARLGIVTARILLDTALALLNHLPLFALMLRLKDPARLPSSVRLAWSEPTSEGRGRCGPLRSAHFELHSVPLGLGDIFAGYSDHLLGLTTLPRLCLGVLTGAAIDPIDTIAQG